jgi:hypothetical protein
MIIECTIFFIGIEQRMLKLLEKLQQEKLLTEGCPTIICASFIIVFHQSA